MQRLKRVLNMTNKWDQYKASKWDQYKATPKSQEPEAPEEGFWEKLPRNTVAGLANLGHRTLNSPHDLVAGLEGMAQNFGESLNSALPKELQQKAHPSFKLSEHIPTQEEHNYAELLGQKGEPTIGDQFIQKGIEYAPDILSLGGIYRNLPIAFTRRGASRELRQAQQLARERNIAPIPVPEHIIGDIRQFLPNTHSYRTLLNEAQLGHYDPLFALQSDLGKASRGYAKSPMFAERRSGREAGNIRTNLLEYMHHGLGRQGQLDIADLLRAGQRRYRNYSRIKPYRNAALLAAGASQIPYTKKLLSSLLQII